MNIKKALLFGIILTTYSQAVMMTNDGISLPNGTSLKWNDLVSSNSRLKRLEALFFVTTVAIVGYLVYDKMTKEEPAQKKKTYRTDS